jgi:hypothetical protein
VTQGVFISAFLGLLFLGTARGQEKKISRADLPPKVQRAVQEISKGATVRGFAEEIENGHPTYEIQMTAGGHSKDIQVDSEGAVLEVEEEVELGSLPAAVTQGLQRMAGRGKITKVESITKKDKLVAYEAQVKKGKKTEVQVGPDGKPLDHEE